MSEKPDSALLLLEQIPVENLSRQQYADWCLLMTQAQDKCNIDFTSDSLIRIAVNYYEKRGNNPERQLLTFYYMGRVSQGLHQAPKAQDYYLKALDAGKSVNNQKLNAYINSNLGVLYTYQKMYEAAIPCLKQTEAYFRQIGDSMSLSLALRDLARGYRSMDMPDSSIFYYQQALAYTKTEDLIDRIFLLNELGEQNVQKDDYQSANTYIQEVLSIVGNNNNYAPVFLVASKIYAGKGMLDSAYYYLYKCMESDQIYTRTAASRNLYQLARDNRQWEEYARLQTMYEALRDSISVISYTEDLERVKAMYDYLQIDKKAKQAESELIRAERNNWIWAFAILFFLLCLICSYFYTNAKQKRRIRMQNEVFQQFRHNLLYETPEYIYSNMAQINELKNELSISAKDKEVIILRIQLLETENAWLTKKIAEKKRIDADFKSSDIYQLFQQSKDKKDKTKLNITEADIKKLIEKIDIVYPTFKYKIINTFKPLSAEDRTMLYLLKADVMVSKISILLGTTVQVISNRRKSLVERTFGKGNTAEVLDKFIASL
ncbi:hypothetical protein AGMMS49574_28250 [Bacteroidia bacterium]|nr:hypothetical protein AGMMS49574_28250 [Bacteroidia bacterium]